MNGIIIAGGLGTRLRPLTYSQPKPLLPVANRPLLEYQVALLKEHGVTDIVFATNYMAHRIEAHFGDGSRFGVRMRYAIEETPLGTGGAIRNAADLFPGEMVVVFNGDILTDFDLGSVIRFHQDRGAAATITLAPVPRPNPFGVLLLENDGRVREWREPSEAEKKALATGVVEEIEGTDLINAGFYVLSPESVARIPQGSPSSIERDIYPRLIEAGMVYGHAPGGFWMDVGRPSKLLQATRAALSGALKTSLSIQAVSPRADVSPLATVIGSAIGEGCAVAEGARIENSVLMADVTVGRNGVLRGVIVDEGSRIEDDVVFESVNGGAVLAAGSILS